MLVTKAVAVAVVAAVAVAATAVWLRGTLMMLLCAFR